MKKFLEKVLFFLKPIFEQSKDDIKKELVKELTPYVESLLADIKVSQKKANNVVDAIAAKIDEIF
jgi:hypothetical protein